MKKQTEKQQKKREPKKLSRRQFLGAVAATTAIAGLAGCDMGENTGGSGWLPKQYRSAANWPIQLKGRVPVDPENPSIVRRDDACILCGQCIEVCQNVQNIHGYYELPVKNEFMCVNCGQCALWCPTASIYERSHIDRVREAILNPDMTVIVQTAPATRVSIGEEFGLDMGTWMEGQQVAALRRLGFDVVLDTNFAADLTIMEEGTELVKRVTSGSAVLPQFTSCCPGWVKFLEFFYPELIPNLSTAKSPMQMFGSMLKTYYAKKQNIDPKKIYSVAVMPCISKKMEASRPEFKTVAEYYNDDSMKDIDAVLSVREFAIMLKEAGIDLPSLPEEDYDSIMGEASGAGLIFGSTGGVMEAALRSAYYLMTGTNLPEDKLDIKAVRGLQGIKEATVNVPGVGDVKVAVCAGLSNARALCEMVKAGKVDYHFIEVMACPGGCISGGGQPRTTVPPSDDMRQKRLESIYAKDAIYKLRMSHQNPEILQAYKEFLGEPGSHLAEDLLHTYYISRAEDVTPKKFN